MKKVLLTPSLILVLLTSILAATPSKNPAISPQEKALIQNELKDIESFLNNNDNPWIRRHNSYAKYNTINNQIKSIQWQLKRIKPQNTEELQILSSRLETLQRQKNFFKDYEDNPYKEITEAKEMGEIPKVTNPIAIVAGFNFLKQIKAQEKVLKTNQKMLRDTLIQLNQKKEALTPFLEVRDKDLRNAILDAIQRIQSIKIELQGAQSILETSIEIYGRQVAELDRNITNQIQQQALKFIYLLIASGIIFGIALATKIALRKYLDQNRLYIANKAISFLYIGLIVLIFLFSYLSNITYLITFLGFISAGLAFAMRDLFMSVLGWFVIVIGGGLHVGDRIRLHRDNTTYIGDILDISITRITLLEDVTLSTYLESRRAGRILFIPNNFIFNTVISNYTHGGMTTIWDGIDLTITFDSNHKKAVEIATEVARKYSKPHIEIAKKRMSRLKERYSLKRISLEPRVFSMIEPNGMRISLWYQANAYNTLKLRSEISAELIDLLAKEQDIKISYPTTKIINTGSDGVWERFTHEVSDERKSVY